MAWSASNHQVTARLGRQLMDAKGRPRRLFDGLALAAILVGSTLRIAHFWDRGAFWGDEAALAYNLLDRSYSQLTRPLDLFQAAPIGFLMIEKLIGNRAGMDENILRLPPLVAGIASLVICSLSFRSLFGPRVAAIATLFLALSPELIRYSCELKPYTLDAAISLSLFSLFAHLPHKPRLKNLWLLATVGTIAPWFSLPSVFVLAGLGGCLLSRAATRGDRPRLLMPVALATLWAASFAVEYFLCLKEASKEPELVRYWSTAFAPFPPGSLDDLRWYAAKAVYFFEPTVGRPARHLALALFLAGSVLVWNRDRSLIFSMLATVAAVLAASALGKYPFSGRLLLFLMPILLIPIAVFFDKLFSQPRWPWVVLGLTLFGLLLLQPIKVAATRVMDDSRARNTIGGNIAMYQSMIAEYRPGDPFLVSPEADWIFRYYSLRYGFSPSGIVYLSKHPGLNDEPVKQILEQGYSRTWLFSSLSRSYLPEGETGYLTKDLPPSIRLVFRRDDEALGFSLRCYQAIP